jgi:hypothetical protein
LSVVESERPAEGSGLRRILIATVIAGVGGYVITALVARALGNQYHLFAIFWSALYLTVGALAGVQQEVTRATHLRGKLGVAKPAHVGVLSAAVAVVVAAIIPASAPLWAAAVFGDAAVKLVIPLSFGAAVYIFVAAASGTMYGTRLWRPLSMIIVLDVVFRLVLVAIGLAAGFDIVALAWATVLPFPLVLIVLWIVAGRKLAGASALDVGFSTAVANVSRTIIAAASTATLVSGFPLLLGASSPDVPPGQLSAVILALTLTRAPLVVSALALQSYLVVFFRDRANSWVRSFVWLLAGLAIVGIVLAACAWLVGSPVIVFIAGDVFRIDPVFLGLLVLSSVPTAWLAVAGTAVLARSAHNYYSAGWVAAAVVAIALLFVPGDLYFRSLIALSGGPMAGLLVHLFALGRTRHHRR